MTELIAVLDRPEDLEQHTTSTLGRQWQLEDAFTFDISAEMLEQLQSGKVLAFSINSNEYAILLQVPTEVG